MAEFVTSGRSLSSIITKMGIALVYDRRYIIAATIGYFYASCSSWWFQPILRILVKLDLISPGIGGENML